MEKGSKKQFEEFKELQESKERGRSQRFAILGLVDRSRQIGFANRLSKDSSLRPSCLNLNVRGLGVPPPSLPKPERQPVPVKIDVGSGGNDEQGDVLCGG